MEEKVTVVIPNFNGRDLLAKNLPTVAKVCPKSEIIVVDDASTDDSRRLLDKNFKKIKVIANEKNLGFARSANVGAGAASGDFILFLNTDVSPQPNFLKTVLEHFKDKNSQNLFAVALADQSHEKGKIIIRGRGGAKFTKGFLSHFAAGSKSGETLWASGGSGLFDKNKFLELGGFDPIFAPFYWEDIDLCWRAQKQGLTCFFDSRARVDHFHEEGAIKKTHSSSYIKTVAYKNQLLFVWKNISDYLMLVQHLLWLPYHFAKALARLDWPFFLGFFWAISQIPKLIFDYSLITTHLGPQSRACRGTRTASSAYSLNDKEVLKKFEKP